MWYVCTHHHHHTYLPVGEGAAEPPIINCGKNGLNIFGWDCPCALVVEEGAEGGPIMKKFGGRPAPRPAVDDDVC